MKMVSESIIQVIQKMVQEGQPREKIISTLQDLGVNEEQAKKLLLIAEADTFTLLKKEINFMVKDEFDHNKKDFDNIIHQELSRIENTEKEKIKELALAKVGDVEKEIRDDSRAFEDKINVTINTSQKTVSMVKMALDSVNERISQLELDVEQLKVHKFRKHTMLFSYLTLAMGAILLIFSIFIFWANLNKLDVQQMIMIAIMILASIVLMFASIVG
jgi:hypothetical protein